LTLSGANNYSGSTVVSNGILRIVPSLAPTNGSVTLDGTAGSPTLSVAPATAGQFATMNGDLTYAAGTVTGDFDFGSLPPSGTVAPIQASGNVVCTVTPQVTIEGSAIPVGTYPLIKYGGSVSGSLPTTPDFFPGTVWLCGLYQQQSQRQNDLSCDDYFTGDRLAHMENWQRQLGHQHIA